MHQCFHAGLVPQHRPFGTFRTGVDGQHGQFVTQSRHLAAHRLDEGRFAGSRDTGYPDAYRTARVGQAPLDNLLGQGVMLRQQTLGQRYRLAQNRDVSRQNPLDIFVEAQPMAFGATVVGVDGRRLLNACRYGQRTLLKGLFMMLFVVFHGVL